MSDDNTDPVRSYLDTEFPGARIERVDDESTRRAGTRLYTITDLPDVGDLEIANEFLDDRSPEEVGRELIRREVADHLRAHPSRVVLLREDGFFLK
jgi:hypothetical protein